MLRSWMLVGCLLSDGMESESRDIKIDEEGRGEEGV